METRETTRCEGDVLLEQLNAGAASDAVPLLKRRLEVARCELAVALGELEEARQQTAQLQREMSAIRSSRLRRLMSPLVRLFRR